MCKLSPQFITKCQSLIKQSIKLVNNFNPNQTLATQLHKSQVLKHLNLPFEYHKNIGRNIGCMGLFNDPRLRLTIFHLPHGVTMKLHDHPKMHVISYILQGSMQATLFNKSQHKNINNDKDKQDIFVKNVKMLRKGDMAITQQYQNNYHQFNAKQEKCSFLDIIFPDYNQLDRKCTYYEFQSLGTGKNQYKLMKLPENYHVDMCQI